VLDQHSRGDRSMIDGGVEVPELNGAMGKFVLITMANVAELEAGLISERTRAALKVVKSRGVKLNRHGAEVLAARYRDEAKQRAEALAPLMREMQSKGYSMRRMASELTKRKVKTPRGGAWHPQTVKQVMNRLGA
jgi:DNA invertase Pin-like site-specific DNA recombinase